MANRVVEVLYRLKDMFTAPVKKIRAGYEGLRQSSQSTASSVERDNTRMSSSLGKLSAGVKAASAAFAAAFAGRAVVSSIGSLADELDRLGKTANRLNIDANTLAALEFAAGRSGVEVSKMAAAIETLQKRTGEALSGLGRAKTAFDSLGLSAESFAALDAEQQLVTIANALQNVASEEERAAIASQLFSKANVDLLNVLNAGGPALQALIREGKEYRTVTNEAAEAAARYNDALGNLSARADGLKFEYLTPAIKELSEFLDNVGAGDQLTGLSTELLLLEKQMNDARNSWIYDMDAAQAKAEELRGKIRELVDARRADEEAAKKQAQESAAQAAANAQYATSVDELTKKFEAQQKVRTEALKKETAEYEAARREQLSIEEEFARLREEITAKPAEDVTGLDIQTKVLEARRRLNDGDADGAVKAAREGGELLRQLQSQGEEAGYVLSFLAGQLGQVANEAAKSKTDVELIDKENAAAGLDELQGKMQVFSDNARTLGADAGKAFVAAFSAELNVELPAPRVAPARPGTATIEWANSTRREVEKRGGK